MKLLSAFGLVAGLLFHSLVYANLCTGSAELEKKIEILQESKNSFLEKLEILLGYKPSSEFIENFDPYYQFDYTQAPKLDRIYLSTLLFRHDFSGAVLAEIIKFHAQRGTEVFIIGTEYMHSDKTKELFSSLRTSSSNIKIQEYSFATTNWFEKLNVISNYFRNNHVKLLITESSQNEADNYVLIGGRNVHDGFLFEKKPDLKKYPQLDQLEEGESFAYWKDIEFKFQSKELVKHTKAQFLNFWNRDKENVEVKVPFKVPEIPSAKALQENPDVFEATHFMSVPFKDNHALEKFYVDLIDSAETSIMISSPYLRPTKKISMAIKRAALERGVEITIQTRIDLKGDTQAWLYEETNKAAINELFDKVKIYEWKGDSILHTKLIVIDQYMSFIGSVNLSRRSFIQDIESGILVLNKDFNLELRDIMTSFQGESKLITEKQKRAFWASLVVYLLQNQF